MKNFTWHKQIILFIEYPIYIIFTLFAGLFIDFMTLLYVEHNKSIIYIDDDHKKGDKYIASSVSGGPVNATAYSSGHLPGAPKLGQRQTNAILIIYNKANEMN